MVQVGMSFEELWMAYFAIGGMAGPDTVRSYLGGAELSRMDYDLLAAAINDEFVDQGDDHPVPYHDELS
jgi:hypothetical protein